MILAIQIENPAGFSWEELCFGCLANTDAIIWGIGKTPEEAWEDAKKQGFQNDDMLFYFPLSRKAANLVRRDGREARLYWDVTQRFVISEET